MSFFYNSFKNLLSSYKILKLWYHVKTMLINELIDLFFQRLSIRGMSQVRKSDYQFFFFKDLS